MHSKISVIYNEPARGCGYRKVGGMYLVSGGIAKACGKMPIPLEVCPCCGQGVKPSRAPTWIEQPERLWYNLVCTAGNDICATCPMSNAYETGAALLIWIGEKFYPTPLDFIQETNLMGISRRINHIPQGFVVGQTWVLLAHRKAIELGGVFDTQPSWQPGIFRMFRPDKIEIIVTGNEPDEVIDGYIERGLTPVMIVRDTLPEQQPIGQQGLWED